MSKLITKARAGVTLVELLVVVLIVTILSVSLLPLLKPFVVEAQYAAEAIPVIGNLRTKIALYQYDKGPLPSVENKGSGAWTNVVETWAFSEDGSSKTTRATDLYVAGCKPLEGEGGITAYTAYADKNGCFGHLIDVDNQELVGKRCKPVHFQYAVLHNASTYCYVLGCFGDNNGLPEGTGYAVCEINVKTSDGQVFKQIGTWKRYKATTDGQISYGKVSGEIDAGVDPKTVDFCAVPDPAEFSDDMEAENGKLPMVQWLESYGWEF